MNMNDSVGKERSAIEGKKVAIKDKHQIVKGESPESEEGDNFKR